MHIDFLLDLAIILIFTKAFGLITKRFSMPQVLGALLAGIILGPTGLNILKETDFIAEMAELGVIVLMFSAGLETDLKELKKCGKASFIIAICGVTIPLAGGYLVGAAFNSDVMQNIFIGIILTATSVSITVETLQELGKLKTSSGTAILGAAVIDDILGVILLTISISSADSNSPSIAIVLLKILAFFVIAGVGGVVLYKVFKWLSTKAGKKRRIPVFGLALCLVLSYVAELFGVADITGAYFAGLILCSIGQSSYVKRRVEIMSYMLLSPIFFASIGIKTSFGSMSGTILLFTVILTIVAILTKVVGCGVGARMCKYSTRESYQIGVGMISRGEVALIVANKGAAVGLMNQTFFGPIIFVVIITTLITPIWLKIVYKNKNTSIKATA